MNKRPKRINFQNTDSARAERISLLESELKQNLSHIHKSSYAPEDISGNIESFLGSIEIPLGLAGPILMNDSEEEYVYAPLATNEGALVASITRGAHAISLSGGFQAHVAKQRMYRCPMFCFQNLKSAIKFIKWIEDNFQKIKNQTKQFSNHAELIEVTPVILGRNIHLQFGFQTGDASGQNMTTTCTWNACLWIEKEFNKAHIEDNQIINFVIEANGSSDKKQSYFSMIKTRGTRVVAEVHLKESVIKRVLKTSSQDILDLYIKATAMAANNGMNGYNVNTANAVAAFFAATGQDLGCIHESGSGLLQMEKTSEGLYVALTLPSLVIGTLGGGTGLSGAKEALKVMDCYGAGKAKRLAKIIAGYALGLEISTMSAIVSGQFANSHEKLGRNHHINWLKTSELNLSFFNHHINQNISEVIESSEIKVTNSIVSDLTARVTKKPIGFFSFDINLADKKEHAILKLKPLGSEVLFGFESIANLVSTELKEKFQLWKIKNSFLNSHTTEALVYESLNSTHPEFIPRHFGSVIIPEREIFGTLIEYMSPDNFTFTGDVTLAYKWDIEKKKAILGSIAQIHKDYQHKTLPIKSMRLSLQEKLKLQDFYNQILIEAESSLDWLTKDHIKSMKKIIDSMDNWYEKYLQLETTLIHNDFNPRNIAFKEQKPCFYDWELAEMAPPQRDLVEFLAFTTLKQEEITVLVDFHRQHMGFLEDSCWEHGCLYALKEFIIDRLSFYLIGSTINQYSFLENVLKNALEIHDRWEEFYG